jgi:hypothetical protein
MEGIADWLREAGCKGPLVVIKDGGLSLDLDGFDTVVVVDAERGFDPTFTLATFHPREVLAVEPDLETLEAVWDSVCVERLFCVGGVEVTGVPAGWNRREFGLKRYCYEKA